MVTTRQFTKGVVRTMRAMDRAAKQAERQRVAQQQALHRQAHLDASSRAAAEYEEIIGALTGAHRTGLVSRDWRAIATSPPVPDPVRRNDEELAAEARLSAYRAGWMTRVLGREERVRQALQDEIVSARARDDAAHSAQQAAAARRNAEIRTAQRVVERDPDAMVRVLEEHSALGALPFSVEGVDTMFLDGRVIAVVDGLDLEDMPEESITLLKSGKASVKSLQLGRRYEIHRDTICSAAVRVALEFLSVLPIDEVEVLMLTDILDRATGHIEARPVLHLRVAAQAVRALNLARTEAPALVERLGGHKDWSKREGFRALNPAAFGIDLAA
ncbi:MAG TPA: hypothetical protein VF631_14515 [Allosphingosinicella sp.]|jgi:hypothetical protein|uniref:hypothetical protein n=1 Tax=Allosphingosinicella sp. TaxID=2823234 RepID=UPI002F2733AE